MNHQPSMAPVVEKAQHEPHEAWFLTGLTAPWVFHSHDVGGSALGWKVPVASGRPVRGKPLMKFFQSWLFMSPNWFMVLVQPWFSELCWRMESRFALKVLNLAKKASVLYALL